MTMDLSQIRMVVSDMDGTLLNSDHKVSNRFFKIFNELKKKRIHFVAASGRQYHSMVNKLNTIKDDIIFIAENGALIKKQDRELGSTPLNKNIQDEILTTVNTIHGAHAMLCGKYTSYFDGKSVQFLNQLKEYYSAYEIVKDYSEVTDEIVKIAVYHNISAEQHIYPKVVHLEEDVKVKVSGKNWVDLNHAQADKGNALKLVMKKFDVSPNELLVFGDYNNDLEMLSLTENSYAMANAHPNVKEVANFITASNDDFGVEKVLELLV